MYKILLFLFFFILPLNLFANIDTENKIKKEISKYERKHLLISIIEIESNFNPKAKSKKGALGLMQVRPSIWHKELKEVGIIKSHKDYYEIDKNISAGNYILSKYISEEKGNIKKALNKYGNSKKYYKKIYRRKNDIS